MSDSAGQKPDLKKLVAELRDKSKAAGIEAAGRTNNKELGGLKTPQSGAPQQSAGGNQRGKVLAKNNRSLTR